MSLEEARRRLRGRRRGQGKESELEEAAEAETGSGPEAPPAPARGQHRAEDFEAAVKVARAARRRLPEAPPEGGEKRLAILRESDPEMHRRLAGLDPWQRAAVLDDSEALLLRAQVGSGKTTVLVEKVVRILREAGAELPELVVMTFTNKAAAEIRERVGAALPEGLVPGSRLRIGTFHSLCLDLLRRAMDEEVTGRSRRFVLLDERARRGLMDELIEREGLRIAYRNRLDRRLERLGKGEKRFGSMRRDDDIERLAELYEIEKRARDRFDFDDLIAFGRATAATLKAEDRPDWIVVDEYQDTDARQLDLLEAWGGAGTRYFAVGDPDQVIYSWRGGSELLFRDFPKRFGGRELSLPRNYRSTETILEAARFLLGPIAGSHDLHANREAGAAVRILRHHDPVAEARHLAALLGEKPGPTTAILVRTREQMQPIREQLEAEGVALRIRERRSEVDVFSDWLLRWCAWAAGGAGPEGAAAVLGDRHLGLPGLKGRKLAGEGEDFEALLERWLPGRDAHGRFVQELAGRARLFAELVEIPPAEELLDLAGLEHFLEPRSSRFEERRRRLLCWLGRSQGLVGGDPATRLRDAVLLGGEEAPEVGEGVEVELMTMHAAKGLEFDRVFLSGINSGIVPLISARSDPEEEAEERRLLFVAMTRARDELEIGWFGKPPRATAEAEPSRWLSLIPDRLLVNDQEVEDEPAAETGGFVPGLCVRHPRYGEGVVVEVEGGQVRCDFGARGEKSFSLTMCPLEAL